MLWLQTPALVATNTAERFPTPLQNDPVFVTIKTAGNCPYVSFKISTGFTLTNIETQQRRLPCQFESMIAPLTPPPNMKAM